MRHFTPLLIGLSALALPATSGAASVEQVFDRMLAKEVAGLASVDTLLLRTETMGISQLEYYEKTSKVDVNGRTMYILRQMPPHEMAQRHSGGGGLADASPDELREAAEAIESQGPKMERAMREEMQKSGLPGGIGEMMMNPPPDEPWLSSNPNDMTQMYGMMLRGAAEGKEEQARRDAEAVDSAHERAQIADRTRLVGETVLDGRPALHLLAKDVNHRQVDNGVELVVRDVHMFVDAEHYVPLSLRMEGTMRESSETREITIERHDQDYRRVPGCGELYRPFRTVMRMKGVMSAAQEQEMREAQVQLAELDKQLAQMPASQRDMVMRQMGPQMEMMRKMVAGGGIEVVSNVNDLQCNVPVPDPTAVALTTFGGGMAMPAAPTGQANSPGQGGAYPVDAGAKPDPAGLNAARQACLEEKIAAAEAAQKKKRGFGRLMNAAGRVASRFGNQDIAQVASDVYSAGATADDLAAAARDLGLTEEEIAECQNR